MRNTIVNHTLMKYVGLVGVTFAVAALALVAACGGDDGGGPSGEIRTEQGLGVALVAANADLARSSAETGDQGGAAVGPDIAAPPSPDERGAGYSVDQVPQAQQASGGITVSGYGTATVEADRGIVEFYFGSYGAVPGTRTDEPSAGGSEESTSQEVTTSSAVITEDDLQFVIDALVAAGIDRDNIEFLGSSYYYDAYWSSATLRVTVRDLDILGDAVAATDASLDLGDISLQSTYISYMVADCGPLEEAALSAAIDDAEARADRFASALGVGRGSLTAAQEYSYSPYGGSSCQVSDIGPYPVAEIAYRENRASDVTLYANVTLTYAIQ